MATELCDRCVINSVCDVKDIVAPPPQCRNFVARPMTNYNRIISKTLEELAEWLVIVEQRILELKPMLERPALYADWLVWLKEVCEDEK